MAINLRISGSDWSALRRLFSSSFREKGAPETGAIALLSVSHAGERQDYLIAQVLWPTEDDFKIATSGELTFQSTYIRKAHLTMQKLGLAGLAFFHTHPFADQRVAFSGYDDQEEPKLIANLLEIDPKTRVVSVVAGKNSYCGRIWLEQKQHSPLNDLVVVGERLLYVPLTGTPPPLAPSPAAIFDRGHVMTDAGALQRLSRLRIVVIGASGTGSLVCELLARAGCTKILLIDADVVTEVNLNRILYARQQDAKACRPKVEVLKGAIEGLGLGCTVEAVQGSILSGDVLARVLEGDVIFGCVDAAYPRLLLCELAYQHMLPYIDVGSEIGADECGIVSVDARTSYVTHGRHCLLCSGVINSRQLEFESLTFNERRRKITLGYCDDLVFKKPAVMDLNMHAAANGVLLLRHLLQPFLLEPLPVTITENLVTYTTTRPSTARLQSDMCPLCQRNIHLGHGDCGPVRGLAPETARQIIGPDPA